jgi:hypothetical protein
MQLGDDCLALALRHAPAWRVALTCRAGARVVRAEAVAVARATGRERRLACHAAAHGDEDTLERLGWADEAVARVAAAHHQWRVLGWCGRRLEDVDVRVAMYAHASGCRVRLPRSWGVPFVFESLGRRGTPEELHALAPFVPKSMLHVVAADATGRAFCEPRTVSLARADLRDGCTATAPAGCDVVTDLRPLDASYSVALRFRDRQTADIALCALMLSECTLVFRFDGTPPERFGYTCDAWTLPTAARADAVVSCRCRGLLVATGGVHSLDADRPDEVRAARAELLRDVY